MSMHKVKKGDTLLSVLKGSLEDIERYPDLMSLDSGSGVKKIYPGDVVTITDKKKAF